MSQISPPLRIVLLGSIVFLAAWFVFLRPGGTADTASAPAPAATTVPAKDPGATTHSTAGAVVQRATNAQQQADAAQAAAMGETAPASGTTAAAPATGATAKSTTPKGAAGAKDSDAKALAHGLPLPVAKAVAAHKVLVMLFWNPKAADDRAVRQAVKRVDRHKGRVVVHVANVKSIARYAPITRGVDVQQSPSVVVVDRKLQGDLLTGYVDDVTIDQAIADALRAGR